MAEEAAVAKTGSAPAPAPTASGAAAAAPAAKGGLMSGVVGPILAVIVLMGIGAGLALFITGQLAPAAHKEEGEAAKAHHEGEDGHEGAGHTEQIAFTELLTNVQGEKGRRYVKVTVVLLVAQADLDKLIPADGHDSKAGDGAIKRSLRMCLEEHLKMYDLDALTAPNIYVRLKSGFKTSVENQLKIIFPETPPDYHYVKDIIINNLLVQ